MTALVVGALIGMSATSLAAVVALAAGLEQSPVVAYVRRFVNDVHELAQHKRKFSDLADIEREALIELVRLAGRGTLRDLPQQWGTKVLR